MAAMVLSSTKTKTGYGISQIRDRLQVLCVSCGSSALRDEFRSVYRQTWHRCGNCNATAPNANSPVIGELSVEWSPLAANDDTTRLRHWVEAWTGIEVEVNIDD